MDVAVAAMGLPQTAPSFTDNTGDAQVVDPVGAGYYIAIHRPCLLPVHPAPTYGGCGRAPQQGLASTLSPRELLAALRQQLGSGTIRIRATNSVKALTTGRSPMHDSSGTLHCASGHNGHRDHEHIRYSPVRYLRARRGH